MALESITSLPRKALGGLKHIAGMDKPPVEIGGTGTSSLGGKAANADDWFKSLSSDAKNSIFDKVQKGTSSFEAVKAKAYSEATASTAKGPGLLSGLKNKAVGLAKSVKNLAIGTGEKLVKTEKDIINADKKGVLEAFKAGEQQIASAVSKLSAVKDTIAAQGAMHTTLDDLVQSAKSAAPAAAQSLIPETGRVAGALKLVGKASPFLVPIIATAEEVGNIDLSKNSLGKQVCATGGAISGRVGGTLAGIAIAGAGTALLAATAPAWVPGLAIGAVGLAAAVALGYTGDQVGGWIGRGVGNFLGNIGEATLGNIFEKP